MSRPAAFLDRDGVLNVRLPGDTYVTRPEELVLLPHAVEAVRELRARGYAIVVVTNQRGVARGFMSAADLERVHQELRGALAARGAPIDAVYACPHGREGEPGAGCACRKPEPGLITQAADELDLDLARSVLIGDSERDIESGRRAGVGRCLSIPSNGDARAVLGEVPPLPRQPS